MSDTSNDLEYFAQLKQQEGHEKNIFEKLFYENRDTPLDLITQDLENFIPSFDITDCLYLGIPVNFSDQDSNCSNFIVNSFNISNNIFRNKNNQDIDLKDSDIKIEVIFHKDSKDKTIKYTPEIVGFSINTCDNFNPSNIPIILNNILGLPKPQNESSFSFTSKYLTAMNFPDNFSSFSDFNTFPRGTRIQVKKKFRRLDKDNYTPYFDLDIEYKEEDTDTYFGRHYKQSIKYTPSRVKTLKSSNSTKKYPDNQISFFASTNIPLNDNDIVWHAIISNPLLAPKKAKHSSKTMNMIQGATKRSRPLPPF